MKNGTYASMLLEHDVLPEKSIAEKSFFVQTFCDGKLLQVLFHQI